jgi:hypothetical protein
MLANSRVININGKQVGRTPALVPSFSSKGFEAVKGIIEVMSQTITDSALISAYDLHHKLIDAAPKGPALLILDSGGYESSKDSELSDNNMNTYRALNWTREQHSAVLDSFTPDQPTLAVTYDHPKSRASVKEQIAQALELFKGRSFGKEILFKPDTEGSQRVNVEAVIDNIYDLRHFDVIGFTEKELGYSLFTRMQNIVKIRKALISANFNLPIHVFGSLDPISTPLYFLAGADIFDGLTWLRYCYKDGEAVYSANASAFMHGIRTNDRDIPPLIWYNNFQRLQDLQFAMKRFLREQDYGVFGADGSFFKRCINEVLADEN